MMKLRKIRLGSVGAIALAVTVALGSPAAWAAGPQVVTYQGMLIDNGSPVTGAVTLDFKLYDDEFAGTLLWSETLAGVSVTDGLFTAVLGETTSFGTDMFGGDRWLDITVNGDTLTTRQQVTAAPNALYSDSTRGIFVDPSGDVGIGTTNPSSELDVIGDIGVSGTVDGVDVSSHAGNSSAHHPPPTSLPPSGPAGGDLAGTYPNPTVDKVDGYDAGNASGQVAVSNTTVCTDLNADMVDGFHSVSFARAERVSQQVSGTVSRTISFPHIWPFQVTVGEWNGAPNTDAVGFVHCIENDGWIAWTGFDGSGTFVQGRANLNTVTTILTVSSGSITLETPGDGTRTLLITGTNSQDFAALVVY